MYTELQRKPTLNGIPTAQGALARALVGLRQPGQVRGARKPGRHQAGRGRVQVPVRQPHGRLRDVGRLRNGRRAHALGGARQGGDEVDDAGRDRHRRAPVPRPLLRVARASAARHA